MVTAAEAHTLGNQLQSDPTQYANNVVQLLGCIKAGKHEVRAAGSFGRSGSHLQQPVLMTAAGALQAAAKAAIQALKLFFLDACDAGDVGRHKRQKVTPPLCHQQQLCTYTPCPASRNLTHPSAACSCCSRWQQGVAQGMPLPRRLQCIPPGSSASTAPTPPHS
jgi:hypothetical protein